MTRHPWYTPSAWASMLLFGAALAFDGLKLPCGICYALVEVLGLNGTIKAFMTLRSHPDIGRNISRLLTKGGKRA